jgi:multicomponent Na+:H+ antiporter subunit E
MRLSSWGRNIAVVVWLVLLWVLLWNDPAPGTMLGGAMLAVVVVTVIARGVQRSARPEQHEDRAVLSIPGLLIYLGYVLVKILQSNIVLAWRILRPRQPLAPGVVRVPMLADDRLTTVMTANAITLTPGTLTIETTSQPSVLYVSALYVNDVEALRRELWAFERYAIRAAGSRNARARLTAAERQEATS